MNIYWQQKLALHKNKIHVCQGSSNLARPQQEAKYDNTIMKNTKNFELILIKYIKSKKDGKEKQEKHIMRK